MAEKTCLRCGQTWHAEIENPIKCGRCKSKFWNTPRRYALKIKPDELPAGPRRPRNMPAATGTPEWKYGTTATELLKVIDDIEPEFLYCQKELNIIRRIVKDAFKTD